MLKLSRAQQCRILIESQWNVNNAVSAYVTMSVVDF